MKLTSNTMNVLKNFSAINQNIYVKSGNVIETVSKQKNILAKAVVEENFTNEFGIFDLNNFLSALTLSKDSSPEIEFQNTDIIIKNRAGKSSTKYRMANKEVLLLPPEKKINMDNAEMIFSISAEDLEWCMKAASALNSANIAFVSDGKEISVEVFTAKDDSSNVNTTVISEGDGKTFKMIFAIENIKFIPGAYDVTIHSRGIGHFKHKTLSLEYWVASENGSSYGG
jgi:hypothetical protein